MPSRSSSRRSWICAGAALVVGLGLYVFDDWCESVEAPLAKSVLNILEIVVMGPAMAVLAFLVSERLRTNEEGYRQGLDDEREKRFRFLGRIAASMAHEVRNPLHNLHLLADELRPQVDEPGRELVERIQGNLERLDQATRLIYALAQPPVRMAGDAVGAVELGPLIGEVVAEAQRRAVEPAALAQRPGEAVHACASREALRIVLHNLVRNAIEAAHGGAVEIACSAEPAAAVVLIRNPGAMPPEFLAEEADGASRKPDGLGVGIAIARHLAAALGGSLRFDCGAGLVCARLELPRAR